MGAGTLFVISGPSGAGKGTLVALLLSQVPESWLSVSMTTRPPRPGDVPGQTYQFVDRATFDQLVAQDGFLEWAEYSGNCYGTPLVPIQDALKAGKQVFLEIEVQGAKQVRQKFPEAKLIFIEPPSLEELERRLRGRGTEDEAAIARRLETAKVELSAKKEYDYTLVNDNLEEAVGTLVSYVEEQAKAKRG